MDKVDKELNDNKPNFEFVKISIDRYNDLIRKSIAYDRIIHIGCVGNCLGNNEGYKMCSSTEPVEWYCELHCGAATLEDLEKTQ
jgi:hypothetical protein